MMGIVDCYVSLWAGCFESDEKLLDYISIDYDEDEDGDDDSQFIKDFGIDYVDEDCIERIFLDNETDSIKYLLSGCSYEDKVIPEFEKIFVAGKKFNCVILVYEMNYDGNINFTENKYCRLEFVGTVKINIKKEI
ncbi:MAG: immunity 22 family protein [Prevotella sp.]|nr:immunity 22 family protein [Alistipes senegalensis]MCM1357993.1 immunity 22 family protein [Prevotella sp.]MCM1472713.1 immunity 22 family protein [Muribaculaceae bacterium]